MLVTCCGLAICKRCAFSDWIHSDKHCWLCGESLLYEYPSKPLTLAPGQHGIISFNEIELPETNNDDASIEQRGNVLEESRGSLEGENSNESESLSDIINEFDPYLEDHETPDEAGVYECGGHWYRAQPHRLNPRCRLCELAVRNVQSLREHILSHFRPQFRAFMERFRTPWSCHLCNKVHKNKASLERHLAWREDLFFDIAGLNLKDFPELLRVNLRRDFVPEYRPRQPMDDATRDRIFRKRRNYRYFNSMSTFLSNQIKKGYKTKRIVALKLRGNLTPPSDQNIFARNFNLRRVRQRLEAKQNGRDQIFIIKRNGQNIDPSRKVFRKGRKFKKKIIKEEATEERDILMEHPDDLDTSALSLPGTFLEEKMVDRGEDEVMIEEKDNQTNRRRRKYKHLDSLPTFISHLIKKAKQNLRKKKFGNRNTQKSTFSISRRIGMYSCQLRKSLFINGLRRQVTNRVISRMNKQLPRSRLRSKGKSRTDSSQKLNGKTVLKAVLVERDQFSPSQQSSNTTIPRHSSCPPTPPASPALITSSERSPSCDVDVENINYYMSAPPSPTYVTSSVSTQNVEEIDHEDRWSGQESPISISRHTWFQSESGPSYLARMIYPTSPSSNISDMARDDISSFNEKDNCSELEEIHEGSFENTFTSDDDVSKISSPTETGKVAQNSNDQISNCDIQIKESTNSTNNSSSTKIKTEVYSELSGSCSEEETLMDFETIHCNSLNTTKNNPLKQSAPQAQVGEFSRQNYSVPELLEHSLPNENTVIVSKCTCATWSCPSDPVCMVCRCYQVRVVGVSDNILVGQLQGDSECLSLVKYVKYVTHHQQVDITSLSANSHPFGQVCQVFPERMILMSLQHNSIKPVPRKGDLLHGICQIFLGQRSDISHNIWMTNSTPWINDDGSFLIESLTSVFTGIFIKAISLQNPNLNMEEEDSIVSTDQNGRLRLRCNKDPDHLDFLPRSFMHIGQISTECSITLINKLIDNVKNPMLPQFHLPVAAPCLHERKGNPIQVIDNGITMRLK